MWIRTNLCFGGPTRGSYRKNGGKKTPPIELWLFHDWNQLVQVQDCKPWTLMWSRQSIIVQISRKGANYVYSKRSNRMVVDDRKKYLVFSYVGEQKKIE